LIGKKVYLNIVKEEKHRIGGRGEVRGMEREVEVIDILTKATTL
jgi:hypothetical protein